MVSCGFALPSPCCFAAVSSWAFNFFLTKVVLADSNEVMPNIFDDTHVGSTLVIFPFGDGGQCGNVGKEKGEQLAHVFFRSLAVPPSVSIVLRRPAALKLTHASASTSKSEDLSEP